MGIIKFILILFTCLLISVPVVIFIDKNDMEIPVLTLMSASPMHTSVGMLSAGSFLLGIVLGLCLCVAYILSQFLELQALKRKAANQEKQIESLRLSSFKDAP